VDAVLVTGARDNGEVNSVAGVSSIEEIEARIAPLRERLTAHPLYAAMRTREDLRRFMESHVYAVWDFMCLLKSLQQRLTCVDVLWAPTAFPASRRFINEIVLGEGVEESQYGDLSTALRSGRDDRVGVA
jgi:hypothetical protein